MLFQILRDIGPNLESLDLSGGMMSPLTDDGLAAVTRYCTAASSLAFDMLRDFTGVTLLPLLADIKRAERLTVLQLSCKKVRSCFVSKKK